MKSKSSTATGKIDCQTCQANLSDYVSLELSGQTVTPDYAEMVFHIETCPTCEAAYYREFYSQGQRKTLKELQQIGQEAEVVAVMGKIVLPSAPDPHWTIVVLDWGRAWLEQETGRWRQLQLSLAGLGSSLGPGQASALAGLMGAASPTAPDWDTLEIAPPDGRVKVKVVVGADPSSTNEALCQIEVTVSWQERFGDFSGLGVVLWGEDTTYTGETDALGRVSFSGLPCQQLPAMSLEVLLE